MVVTNDAWQKCSFFLKFNGLVLAFMSRILPPTMSIISGVGHGSEPGVLDKSVRGSIATTVSGSNRSGTSISR
jgi:hypothetical protein